MSATPADDAQTSPAWNCGCKDTIIFGEMQIKIAFWCDFFSGGRKEYGVEVGSCAKRSLKFKV